MLDTLYDYYKYYLGLVLFNLRLLVVCILVKELSWYLAVFANYQLWSPVLARKMIKSNYSKYEMYGHISKIQYSLAYRKYSKLKMTNYQYRVISAIYLLASDLDLVCARDLVAKECRYYGVAKYNKNLVLDFLDSLDRDELEKVKKRLYL